MDTRLYTISDDVLQKCQDKLNGFGVWFTYDEVMGASREAELVFVRALLFYMLRRMEYRLEVIGEVFGRTHATVIHSLCYSPYSKELKQKYDGIILKLKYESSYIHIQAMIAHHKRELIRLELQLEEYEQM